MYWKNITYKLKKEKKQIDHFLKEAYITGSDCIYQTTDDRLDCCEMLVGIVTSTYFESW